MYSDGSDAYGGAYGGGAYGGYDQYGGGAGAYGGGGQPGAGAYGGAGGGAAYGAGGQQQGYGGYGEVLQGMGVPLNPLVTDMARQYGDAIVGQGRAAVDEKIARFVTVSKLKYYFAVDTTYVVKKMGLLFFPFTHKDWSIHYDRNEDDAVQPRFEVNAPDLYIPLMAFITYILVAGIALGTQQKFSPEGLGLIASSAAGWLVLELMAFAGANYVIQTDLKVFDLLTFCAYKFVGMIFVLICNLLIGRTGYLAALGYFSLSLSVFLVRTLKKQIYSVTTHEHVVSGNKRRLYFLLTLAAIQPVLMWWLTYHL